MYGDGGSRLHMSGEKQEGEASHGRGQGHVHTSVRPSVYPSIHPPLHMLLSFQVFDKLQDINHLVNRSSSSCALGQFQSLSDMDFSGESLSRELSKRGPLENTYQPALSSQSSSSSSSFCSLQSPRRLHSPSSLVSSLSSCSLSPSSLAGPCETDESQGFSQYDLQSQLRTHRTSCGSVGPSTKDRHHSPTASLDPKSNQPSVPAEEQYSLQPSGTSRVSGSERSVEQELRWHHAPGASAVVCGVPKSLSPVGSLQSVSPRPSGMSAA